MAVVALVAIATSAVSAQESGGLAYRVAGTMDMGAGRAVAMIESSDGKQALYRPGDVLDGWEITGIDLENVTLYRSGQSILLPLQGKLMVLESPVEEVPEQAPSTTGSKNINFDRAFARLQELEAKPGAEDEPLTYADINAVLGLAASTQIREVDGQKAESPSEVLQLAMIALATDLAFRTSVEENPVDEIYLVPADR